MAAKIRWERASWWLIIHAKGRRHKTRFGPTKADKRRAERAAEEVNHRLALGQYEPEKSKRNPVPFDQFAFDWLRREILIPLERGIDGHVAPGTARSYGMHVRVHLTPYFRDMDVRAIRVADIQSFYDHCIDRRKPRSSRSIELVVATLRLILSHSRAQGLIEFNAVEGWKRGKGRRRSSSSKRIDPGNVLSFDELQALLAAAWTDSPQYYPLILFLADTGARFGEATSLRWIDVDLDHRTARIARSYSSGMHLGPTKTGRERMVELSTRLCEVLAERRPDLFHDDTLVFPNQVGGFIDPGNFRERIWGRLIRRALGRNRNFTPHGLRHTFVSIHMARGTNLKWIQEQGGWTSAKLLLDTYGHFMPSEMRGFADTLSASPDGTIRHQPADPARRQPWVGVKTRAPSRMPFPREG